MCFYGFVFYFFDFIKHLVNYFLSLDHVSVPHNDFKRTYLWHI